MAENITTIYEMYAARDPQDLPGLDDLVLVESGTGSERDKPSTLREIGELLMGGGGLDEIELKKALVGGGYKVVTIDGESMEFSQYGGSNPDGTTTEVSMLGIKISLSNQGYDTETELTKDGLVVSYGQTGSAKEKTEVLYNKVRAKAVEGTSAGTGSENAKELVIASGLHIRNSGGSQYLMVDGLAEFDGSSYFNGNTEVRYDLHVSNHVENGQNVNANLEVDGRTKSLELQVGQEANKVIEASPTKGIELHKHTTLNAPLAIGGIVVDCTSDTNPIDVESKVAPFTADNSVVVLYVKSGAVLNLAGSVSFTVRGLAALPFFIQRGATNRSVAVPMFLLPDDNIN